ncbi:hypothetical protein [Streptomyces sioyaensis]|uniref:hypothetical protein n=1 Tax=Streptomyces sioyaensis TaxID=67364 RepID=UPI0037974BEC
MGLFNRSTDSASKELKEARADLNERFNHRDADPDSAEYLAAHDRVIAAENNARH